MFRRDKFDYEEALDLERVSEVYSPNELRPAVAVVVRQRLPEAPATALRFTKVNFVAAERMSFADVVEVESERHMRIVARPEFSGRARALQQRSAP
jgi:enoyl-CoA hydratase/carnithine racemase